jgi:hypothetical protein
MSRMTIAFLDAPPLTVVTQSNILTSWCPSDPPYHCHAHKILAWYWGLIFGGGVILSFWRMGEVPQRPRLPNLENCIRSHQRTLSNELRKLAKSHQRHFGNHHSHEVRSEPSNSSRSHRRTLKIRKISPITNEMSQTGKFSRFEQRTLRKQSWNTSRSHQRSLNSSRSKRERERERERGTLCNVE